MSRTSTRTVTNGRAWTFVPADQLPRRRPVADLGHDEPLRLVLLAEVDPLDAAGVEHRRLEVAVEALVFVDVAKAT